MRTLPVAKDELQGFDIGEILRPTGDSFRRIGSRIDAIRTEVRVKLMISA
jgi:hypothetical protein